MATDMIEIPELAVDRLGRQFVLHPDTRYFIVERHTNGNPYVVRVQGKLLLVDALATFSEFSEELGHRPGLYRLRQADAEGRELDAPAAFAEIEGESFGGGRTEDAHSALALCHRMAQANEHQISIVAEMVKALMHTHVQLQSGAARMMEAATTTIRVANGVESIERGQTIIDVDRITERVIEAMDEREPPPAKPMPPWFVQLLASPLGLRLLQILENAFPTQPRQP